MEQIHIQLEDWQQAALKEMAHTRGVEVEALATSILNERLVERIHTAFDDLMCDDGAVVISDTPTSDTIEQRLRRLFEA
jgi:hypothetical protein